MKHIFIVNPVAGQGAAQKQLICELERRTLDFYLTKSSADCENYIKGICEANLSENIRFYACGGDGTLNDVVNGIFGFENVEAACIPLGSGNDFIRNFDIPAGSFRDIDKQLSGNAVTVDLIKYTEKSINPEIRYATNMFNIGFDCNVVAKTAEVKKYPLVSGSLAYFISILIMLIKKEGADLKINFDDGTGHEGPVLLTAIGNGAFCGGGIKGVSLAFPDDGLLDVCVIKNVPRRVFVALFSKYANGTYLEDKRAKDVFIYRQCRKITVKGNKGFWRLCVDGEIKDAVEIEFEIVPHAMRFSLPSK